MRTGIALAALLGVTGAASALDHYPRQPLNEDDPGSTAPKRFIVEYKSRAHASRLVARAAEVGLPGFRIVKRFDSDIFPGVAVECERECNLDSVTLALDSDGEQVVASVYKSQILRIVPPIEGESFSDDATALNYSVHGMTGVEELHGDGILGEGATVAIVDSGVQYTHPALGGGIGPNYTVVGGLDLVGDKWPDAPPQPDGDVMDVYGHGTHVAGIVAGKSEKFVGVAPKAKILSFKVFGSTGYSNEETVIEGMLKAYDSGADIISASVGEGSGFIRNALAVVASRIVDSGVVVVFAAGNDGDGGPFSMSNGASGEHVLTVGASDPGVFPAQGFSAVFSLDGASNKTVIAYIPGFNFFPNTIVNWPVKPITLNTSVEADACELLPKDTAPLNGTVVLARLGGCNTTVKYNNLKAFGAEYVLLYSDGSPYTNVAVTGRVGFVGAIESDAGAAIIGTVVAGGNVTVSFDISTENYVGLSNAGGGRPAAYTSWGSTYDLALKPDIAGPGTRILSTYPTDAYRVLSGTSMATPYIAGIAALWVGKFGGRAAHKGDPDWARRLTARITTTGRAVPWADWSTSPTDYGFWAPTTQVGGGFVDARRVLRHTTELSFEGRKFELNDTAHFVGAQSVDITNTGADPVTYKFSLQDAGGYEAYQPSKPGVDELFVPSMYLYPSISPAKMTPGVVLAQEMTVGAGETKAAEFKFSVPEGVNADKLPVYSGKILISGSNGEELGVPYFGVACSLNETIENVWAYGWRSPSIFSGQDRIALSEKANFTFNLTREGQDFPQLSTRLVWGTLELRWDIFSENYTEAQWSYPPSQNFIGSATSWAGASISATFDPSKDSVDDLISFPVFSQPRDREARYQWLGRLAQGSQIQPGRYKFRIAALRPFGNPERSQDWDIWPTPTVTVLPLVG
ncbi:subtilase [Colletotrichum cereale]|nr:subtilase [Colletotrichum cereale]